MKAMSHVICCAAAFLLTAIAPRVPAQNLNDDNMRRGCERAAAREQRRCEGEMETLGYPVITSGELGRLETRLQVEQISEDLSFLQTVTEHLAHAAAQSDELDFKAIAKLASEVKKRAGRLKNSLALPGSREGFKYREEKVPANQRELRDALSSLSSLISDAVRNPVLRGYLLNLTRSFEARSELEKIVELSARIRVSSEMLRKNGL